MKLTKENVCVFIEDEAQLEQARELLVKYKQDVFHVIFYSENEYLMFDEFDGHWFMCDKEIFKKWEDKRLTKITLTELEKIFSDGKETE